MLIVGIVGSLRGQSFNGKLMDAFGAALPSEAKFQVVSLADVPLYNADLDGESPPRGVVELKAAIAAADGVVIATPEFNYGIPGVLKNALDWASRPGFKSVFSHKPVTCFGAAIGAAGTARAQGQLKLVLLSMLAEIYPAPELTIGDVKTKLADDGTVKDEALKSALGRRATEFAAWVNVRAAAK